MTQVALPPRDPLRIVFDTNVLLSLWVFADRRYARLPELIAAGRVLPLTGAECLAEFERVLDYPEFELDAAARRRILTGYAGSALCVNKEVPAAFCLALPLCRDTDDQKFLELARDGRADALVTSDKALLKLARRKLLTDQFRILTPERFLGELLI